MTNLVLVAPMQGWSAPLEEVPDAVFTDRLLGDGLAIDPTGASLHAPCDGEIIAIPPQKHAVTLRATNGAEILLHVGIDTVGLGGEGFVSKVEVGARVKAGELLLQFDLDLLARRAKSLLTPVIITDSVPFSIVRRVTGRPVAVGDFLMELAPVSSAQVSVGGDRAPAAEAVAGRVVVLLEHGVHARPAALLANRIKHFAATVTVSVRGKSANARSPIGLMSLGIRKGDEVQVGAVGPDAVAAVDALTKAIRDAVDEVPAVSIEGIKSPQSPAGSQRGSLRPMVGGLEGSSERSIAGGSERDSAGGVIRGVVAAPGFAVGVAVHLVRAEIAVVEAGAGVQVEAGRLEKALSVVRMKLRALVASEHGPGREIITAHLEFLDDPELSEAAQSYVTQGKSAGFAWRTAVRNNVNTLRALPDARMTERADDLLDLESQVLTALEGDDALKSQTAGAAAALGVASGTSSKANTVAVSGPGAGTGPKVSDALPERAIVLANELLPSQLVAMNPARLAGICTSGGGPTSHVAILAAAMNVPMLVAAGPAIADIAEGAMLVLDAERGVLHAAPSPAEFAAAETSIAMRRERRAIEREAAQKECRTADGTRIEVFANVGSVSDARTAVAQGAEGCGLLRTEFLFLDREHAPDEATQLAEYQQIVDAFAGRPVVIRTLDVGGDKPLAYMPLPPEDNPALGVRGVRVSLLYPNVLAAQLRAILRVQPRGRCRILIPMISDADELRAVREILEAARRDVGHHEPVLLGAMIETPGAAMLADQIAREADFLSIGTNDLTQYSLAMDRGNPALAGRLDALHPAVLRLIATAASAARANQRDIAVCGGLASDLAAAAVLIGLGVNELSAVPSVVPRLKSLLGSVTLDACQRLAASALKAANAAEVRQLVAQWIDNQQLLPR